MRLSTDSVNRVLSPRGELWLFALARFLMFKHSGTMIKQEHSRKRRSLERALGALSGPASSAWVLTDPAWSTTNYRGDSETN